MLLAFLGLVMMTALMLGWRSFLLPNGGARPHVALKDGVAVLRPPRGRNLMLAALALAPTLLLVGVLTRVGAPGRDDQFGVALALALLALGGWVVLWFMAAEFRQCLRVDARSIERVFAITRLRVTWAEVERIRWNPGSRWFFIVAAGAWLWVPVDFDGIADFAQQALVSLPPSVLQADPEARPILEALVSAPPLSHGGPPLG